MCSGLQASACNMPWTRAEAILPNPKKPNVMIRRRLRFTTRSAKTLQAFGESSIGFQPVPERSIGRCGYGRFRGIQAGCLCYILRARCRLPKARIIGVRLAFEINDHYSCTGNGGRSVCISGLRLSVKLRENAKNGGPGYCSLFSRL